MATLIDRSDVFQERMEAVKQERRHNPELSHYSPKKEAQRHYQTRRRHRIKMATPPWADHKKIAAIYAEARRKTNQQRRRLRGEARRKCVYVVDHVIPLHGKNVCGLHTPENMQVIGVRENSSKTNRF